MSTTINWSTMSNRQRDAFIAEHVLGQEVHAGLERGSTTETDYYFTDPDNGRLLSVACYSTDLRIAWHIIRQLETTATLSYTPAFIPQEPDGRAAHCECEIIQLDPISGNDKVARAIANTPSEAICVAALRWVGIQVTNTIEAIPCWQLTYEDGQKAIFRDRHHAEHQLAIREQYLKDNLQWARNIRKLKIEEVRVPEDYFNGPTFG